MFRKLLKINARGRRFTINVHFGMMPYHNYRNINVCVYFMALSQHKVSAIKWNLFPRLEERRDVNVQRYLCLVAEAHFLILSLTQHRECVLQFLL
jgi:hypothetical protein